MVGVKIKKHGIYTSKELSALSFADSIHAYEDVFKDQRAYVYLVSPANLRPDGWVFVSDQGMLEETIRRLKEEGRNVNLKIKTPNQTIEKTLEEMQQ